MSATAGPRRWAICCSGGGIRSAAYCLGALQRLERDDFLDKTAVIIGVSGGSYIAASRALVAHGLAGADEQPEAGLRPYQPGTPEEQHLRRNTRYVAPDAKTLLAGVLTLLLGVAVTLVLVLAPVFAVAHVWGWILRATGTLTYASATTRAGAAHWTASVTAPSWYAWPVIVAGGTLVVFLCFWASLAPDSRGRDGHSQKLAKALGWGAFLSFALALAMLAVPELIAWVSTVPSLQTVLDDLGLGQGAAWTPAALAGFAMAAVAVAQSAQMGLAKFNALKAQLGDLTSTGTPGTSPGLAATISSYVREMLLPWLASALIVAIGFIAAVHWVKDGAAAGFGAGQAGLVIGALAVMLAARFATDVNRISLHDIYRWRLTSAYGVERATAARDGGKAPSGTRYAPGVRLSDLRDERPPLVLCTTANINAEREVPAGRGGVSFTFDARHATLRGLDPRQAVQADIADYEALVGKRRLTLFDVSAISGAAFSPLMGAATQQAHRILFTATGLRLGVWLPHPAIVAAASEVLKNQGHNEDAPSVRRALRWLGLLCWYLLPHPAWGPKDTRRTEREARLWSLVLRLRRADKRWPGLLGVLLYRALQPTLGMLYAEAAGHTSYRSTWMCVTDGGHYDNLGLVEALQRREDMGITHVLVLDASGDQADTFFTLGGAIALARSDAATEIDLDPTTMIYPLASGMSGLLQGEVVRPWATGTITKPAGLPPNSIVVCKLGWWKSAPWDVCAYAAGHSSYPTESTLDQLYDVAEFDAYRQLGWSAVEEAIAEDKLAPDVTARPAEPPAAPVAGAIAVPSQPASAAGPVIEAAGRRGP